jgi:phosphocarrier protein
VIERELTIVNKLGLHARAAGALVKLASTFASEITVEKGGVKVNAKSIMGLLMLAASMGSTVRMTVQGDDEKEAAAAVEGLVTGKFNEE